MAERITVDRREALDALRAVSASFETELDTALLGGKDFTLSELEDGVVGRMELGSGNRPVQEIARDMVRDVIAARRADGRDLSPEDRLQEVWPDSPLALRTALWEHGRYVSDAVRLDWLGRLTGLAMSFALMVTATAAIFLEGTIVIIALAIFLIAALIFTRSPGAMNKDATLQSLAQNILENNVAKLVAAGGRLDADEARALLRRLLFRKLALDPDRIGPDTVLRPRYHPFRIRRTAFR